MSMVASAALAALAAGWGVTLRRAAARERRAEAAYPPQGRMLEVGGARIHAVEMGAGPDVVLIHGSSGSVRDMSFALAPALADRYRVILFDRPGMGHSTLPEDGDASLSRQAELLSEAALLLGSDRPVVVGQSYGGAVALAWAVHHPERMGALVPVAAVSHPWEGPLDPFYRITSSWLGGHIVVPLISAYVSDVRVAREIDAVFAPQSAPGGYSTHFGPSLTLRRSTMRANASQRARLKAEIQELHHRYGDIAVPTEIVHGTADRTVGLRIHSEPLSRRIPGAVLTPLDGIGHMPHQVATADVAAAIDRAAARAGLR